ncbi:MAG TPA: hypothetical protein VKA02_03380 [Candidatus Acidoferrum sp.]|nr:hypothetical protein [Candidatus Acidoferrum sp.]
MTESTLPYDGKNADHGIAVDENGGMTYSGASREGRIEIEIPALKGSPNPTETLHAVNFGPHTASKIEASMDRQGYLKSGPLQNGPQTFAHYVAVAKGAGLLDAGAQKNADALVKEFSVEPNQREYFAQVVRPWLHTLSPGKR